MCDLKGMDGWMLKAVGSTLFRPSTFRTCAKGMTKKSFQMALSCDELVVYGKMLKYIYLF